MHVRPKPRKSKRQKALEYLSMTIAGLLTWFVFALLSLYTDNKIPAIVIIVFTTAVLSAIMYMFLKVYKRK